MSVPNRMTTLSEVLEKLRLAKLDNEFRMTDEGFKATASNQVFKPDELTITKVYRFEGFSDPADNSALYIIEAANGLKGYALDSYGMYSDYSSDAFDSFIRKIPVNEKANGEH
ncbi:hypothetical protein C3K47_05975 [Solitalea longa]|uniref:Phosphoribosylpyrophosphate synthetase n=2 Tax=Solitalea longa TaxID=2079460 RepID=A0A2S5A404_9SPHI|nr:hypothetical protein C3K47_05975 [Solitalea longa]